MAMQRGKWMTADVVVAMIVAMGCLVASAADDPVLTTAYGTGVHAYHAGDYQRSYDDLSAAIDGGSADPRAFYFRGLAALKLGRLDEADADFATGAMREAAALGTWNVPRSLERVQGEDRLRLERHRARARVALMQRRREAIVRRYTETDAAQESVLRTRRPEAVPAPAAAPAAESDTADEGSEPLPEPEDVEPAQDDADEPAEEPAEDEGEAATDDADTPFGDDATSDSEAPAEDEADETDGAEEAADTDEAIAGEDEPGEADAEAEESDEDEQTEE